jgi:hypothetical protein
MVREPHATMQPAPQDNQLMAKHRVLSLKPHLRLEWRGQDGHNETEQPNHSASLGDSITSSTRMRFRYTQDRAKPIAPVRRHVEPCIRKRPMVRRHLLDWHWIVEFHAQGDHRVFFGRH